MSYDFDSGYYEDGIEQALDLDHDAGIRANAARRHLTVWQENAARFATTRQQLDDQLATRRREGIRQVLDRLVDGQPGAHYLLQRSFLDQLAIAGLENAGFPTGPTATEVLPGVVRLRTGGRHAAPTPERTAR